MTFDQFIVSYRRQCTMLLKFIDEAYDENSDDLFVEDSTDTQFVWKEEADEIYLAFAGTDSIRDIVTDLHYARWTIAYDNTSSPIRLHSGFYRAYLSVRAELTKRLTTSESFPNKNIFIAGHSLGGALALLCALDFAFNYPTLNIFLLTIGQPRVGNRAFVRSVDTRLTNYFRVVNGDDIVTKYPLSFHHAGQLVSIGNRRWWKLFSIADHYRDEYTSRLSSALGI